MEKWKDIPGYEGKYQASDLGRVRSLIFNKVRILKSRLGRDGYLKVGIRKNKNPKTYKVHQLIAMTFLNHVPNGHKIVVDHKNTIRTDNRLNNLRLISQRENLARLNNVSSKYVGVSWLKDRRKWRAQIRIKGKSINLGDYTKEVEAHKAYQKALT